MIYDEECLNSTPLSKALLPFYSIIILKMNNWTEQFCQMTWYRTVTDYWFKFLEKEMDWLDELKSFLTEEFEALKQSDLTKEENYKKITEFVMMMNWRSWWLDDNGRQWEIEWLYIELREEYNDWCYDNLKGSAMKYYFRTTD
jgi:hypothetical protein